MQGNGLGSILNRVRAKLEAKGYPNESAVREAIVLPVLQQLGWDIFDTDSVRREYPVRTRRVDYALFAGERHPSLLVEVKAVGGADANGDTQLFEYAFHEGVQMALLTDGQAWNFYLPMEGGSYGDRRVYQLDLVERDIEECEQVLRRYLDFSRVKSGEAIADARNDYRYAKNARIAQESLSAAWVKLLAEPDDVLVALLADKAEAICGFAPSPAHTREFITGLGGIHQMPPPPARKRSALRLADLMPTPERQFAASAPPMPKHEPEAAAQASGSRKAEIVLDGRRQPVSNAKDGLVAILRHLASRDPSFYKKLSEAAQTRSRNHVASKREEVYPERPDLTSMTLELAPGWWLGTNISNREKLRIARKACEIAGVTYGEEVALLVPDNG